LARAVDAEGARSIRDANAKVENKAESGAKRVAVAELRVPASLSDVSLREQSDLQLLAGLRVASEPHFNELYNRYFQRIYSFVYTRMRNHADTEEVVQETFTAVYRSFESYRGTSSLLSWIYGIARNTLNNSLRRTKTEGQRLNALHPEALWSPSALGDCTPEEHLSLRRYAQAIRDRLETVAEWQSEIFAMRHLQNMSIREICDRTNRSSDAIRSSLYRVKRLLFETAEIASADAGPPGGGPWTALRGERSLRAASKP
jgi:RNA polymerase sigma-70 factor (ECF subfamily)